MLHVYQGGYYYILSKLMYDNNQQTKCSFKRKIQDSDIYLSHDDIKAPIIIQYNNNNNYLSKNKNKN